jgi:hypothetical protein
MPVLRYFLFVGGALLALLFVVNAFLPTPPAAQGSTTADLSIIRIHSDQKWPERIVFDTTHPIIVAASTPAATVIAEASSPQKATAAVKPAPRGQVLRGQVREAFAQLRPNPGEFRSSEAKRKRRAVAKNYLGAPPNAAPPVIVVAQQPRFGFFGSNIW